MQFTREPISQITVRRIERGRLSIGDDVIESTVAIAGGRRLTEWSCPPLAALTTESLTPLLEHEPDVLIVGSGWSTERPANELVFALARRGIGLECMQTPAACRTFNILVAEDRNPAAILYLD